MRRKQIVMTIATFLAISMIGWSNTTIHAFTGNKTHTQALIVSNSVLDQDGKLIDPDTDATENSKNDFIVEVKFSNLHEGDKITYTGGTIVPTPVAEGTASFMYKTGNCTPMYFDNVPVNTKIKVTIYQSQHYFLSYKTEGFQKNVKSKDIAANTNTTLTTRTFKIQDGKDGVIIFSAAPISTKDLDTLCLHIFLYSLLGVGIVCLVCILIAQKNIDYQ